ncbi:MAG: hypothetical protein GY797_26430 [Deltaproteobacteria bacterium]|nr:hypothetical protein [Deltaproteobacteria bacterium]
MAGTNNKTGRPRQRSIKKHTKWVFYEDSIKQVEDLARHLNISPSSIAQDAIDLYWLRVRRQMPADQ